MFLDSGTSPFGGFGLGGPGEHAFDLQKELLHEHHRLFSAMFQSPGMQSMMQQLNENPQLLESMADVSAHSKERH